MAQHQLEFTLSKHDLAEAYRGARRRLLRRYLSWKGAAALVAFIALLILAAFIGALRQQPTTPAVPAATQPDSSITEIFLSVLPWLLIFGATWAFLLYRRRKLYKNHRLIDRPHTLIIEDDKLTWIEPFSRLEYLWKAFYGFKATRNMFVLYLSDPKNAGILMFHMIPKRAFASEQEAAEFERLLNVKIQASTTGFPVIQTGAETVP